MSEPQDRWSFAVADYDGDGVPDVWAIKRDATGTGTTELHIVDGADPTRFLRQTATALGVSEPQDRWSFAVADYDGDGVPDVWAIKRDATGTGTTELHIVDGADPTRFLRQTATALGVSEPQDRWSFAVADYDGDGVPDVWAIKRDATGTGTTELHIVDGADPTRFLRQTATALAPATPQDRWSFASGA